MLQLRLLGFKAKNFKGIYEHFLWEVRNRKSPIFLHELACRTTTVGKYNLNLVVEFVLKKGFVIKYEDTDSLYLTCPDIYYEKCDEVFSRKELSKEARMREKNERILDPSECFSYIIVKGSPLYNKEDRKEPYKVGDFMEYADIAKEQNLKIYINYYLRTTTAICICFINKNDNYQSPLSDRIMQIKYSDKREKQIDEYSQKKTKIGL
ncbi:19177_t:CDS:2 [Funneliformis geosporum]|uniref:19177_t:CDS:1 n=1 Tax=Funneliformis geosporum TaxID=1117311 RepID=A0A9W4SI64_9GLOM|nr:19177_t:CDS:2 [Funneliformis geosporum]